MEFDEQSVQLHKKHRGKLATVSKVALGSRSDLSIAYTPGVAAPCLQIERNPALAYDLTIKANSVAVITDGSAVLGLGNIGPLASLPVMEGKAILFKEFAGIDAWPICLDTQDEDQFVTTVRHLAPVFGGINLEDISAPRCFAIEERLQDLGIPVFHDDQHGTAIVVLAALMNACRVVGRPLSSMRVVINGAGAAGTAIATLLRCAGDFGDSCIAVKDLIVCDRMGAIHAGRVDIGPRKLDLLRFTNRADCRGPLKEALKGADIFIGVSECRLLQERDVRSMAKDPIILAMANPEPEIRPDLALRAGAAVVGTGRSDFPNQVNNVLAFPGIFRGALDARAPRITGAMKLAAAVALAETIVNPTADRILPLPTDRNVASVVAQAVVATFAQLTEGLPSMTMTPPRSNEVGL
jgi:malate dehydrogenase (oxaloacetate-decarboxylating)